MQRYASFIVAFVLTLVFVNAIGAQDRRFSGAVKGGATIENSEDGLDGTAPAVGITGTMAFNASWSGEVEFWLPGYLKDERGQRKHRDILLSFSALRYFHTGAARPYLLAGLSFTRTQDWFTFCTALRPPATGGDLVRTMVSCDAPDVIERRRERNDGRDGYVVVGGGIEIPFGRRLNLVTDVRLALAPASVLVRPSIGLSIDF